MKSFTQYLETINHEDLGAKGFLGILHSTSTKDMVKFALYCLEDVAHLMSDRQEADKCIHFANKWLVDPLDAKTSDAMLTLRYSIDGIISRIAKSIIYNRDAGWVRHQAAGVAVLACRLKTENISDNRLKIKAYEKEKQRYRTIAGSFSSHSTNKPNLQTIHTNDNDTSSLMAIADELGEHKEDFIQQVGDKFKVNLPGRHEISGNSYGDVIDKIVKNNDLKWILNYVRKLYRNDD